MNIKIDKVNTPSVPIPGNDSSSLEENKNYEQQPSEIISRYQFNEKVEAIAQIFERLENVHD